MAEDPNARPRGIRTNRVEAFSDGVFAIAITLLVLELGVPERDEAGGDLLAVVIAQWPSYLAYIVSFATIGTIWLAHSVMTEYLDHVDPIFVRVNLLLLLVISFLPFPTRLLAEHISVQDAERVAVTVYGVSLLLASVIIAVLWRYALRAGLVRSDVEDEETRALTSRFTPGLVGYVGFIALGLFLPVAAVVGYLLLALSFLIPIRRQRSA